MHFWPKKHFSAECKNDRFSVIPARTGSVAILGHFLMARTVPPSFVDHSPKLGLLIIVIRLVVDISLKIQDQFKECSLQIRALRIDCSN